jgi:hypothetical protein
MAVFRAKVSVDAAEKCITFCAVGPLEPIRHEMATRIDPAIVGRGATELLYFAYARNAHAAPKAETASVPLQTQKRPLGHFLTQRPF